MDQNDTEFLAKNFLLIKTALKIFYIDQNGISFLALQRI